MKILLPAPRSIRIDSVLTRRLATWILLGCAPAAGQSSGAAIDFEYFEKHVRPVLAEKCYACHSAQASNLFAGLRLDSKSGLLRGGDSGPAIVPRDSAASLLLKALRGEAKTPMPPTGRLPAERIAAIAAWVDAGAPWPQENAPGLPDPSEAFDLEARRSSHWAWQPVKAPPAPDGVDGFILAKLRSKDLQPSAPADRHTLLRRLSFAVTGLPPSPQEIRRFVNDPSPNAYAKQVDRLLASPHYGERWARHWMDLVRYTESHGSEGDPDTLQAWRYRDYLIRALNADVPYDQLIREHLAGDLLPNPRINQADGINESIVATAHYRMIEHGFQPVDPWEDRVKWTDNQIDVFSKAFQGLTVSCARCHDHKFDAVSQRDYYALFGILKNARPTQRAIDSPQLLAKNSRRLTALKRKIKDALAAQWSAAAADAAARLRSPDAPLARLLEQAACDYDSPLFPFFALAGKSAPQIRSEWPRLAADQAREQARRERFNNENFPLLWNVAEEYPRWIRHGSGLGETASAPGEFSITPSGARIVEGIYGAGAHTALLSRRRNGVLQSPRFRIETNNISFRVQGGNFSVVRLIIENYAVPRGGIYHLRYSPRKDEPVWYTWDTTYWKGFTAYVEFATLDDSTNFAYDPVDSRKKPDERPKPVRDGRSFFGATAVAFHDGRLPPENLSPAVAYLFQGAAPDNAADLTRLYRDRLKQAVAAWRRGRMSEEQAAFLDFFVRNALLPVTAQGNAALAELTAEYRRIENDTPIYRRAPGVIEEAGDAQRLLIRGGHKNPADPVPRRYLTALGGKPYDNPATMRLRLAQETASASNPLTARVMVNRIRRHMFGRGIVASVDNFGRLGNKPSHPELLDYLAAEFVDSGWSIKRMIRRLALTDAYRRSSNASPRAATLDPDNALLQHMPVRRLEGEAIRDSLLAVSGRLDRRLEGASIPIYYAFAKGKTKGDRPKGPLDGEGRRSVYQEIRRNAHNPFLEVFDQPKPASTRGRRDSTNVPAQSLTMLNSPLVIEQAEIWGKRIAANPADGGEKINAMFLQALGRPPSPAEIDRAQTYMADGADARAWTNLAHALFNLKEFIYLR